MNAWQIRLCIKGYYRRNRDMWSAARWQAYQIMRAQVGDDNLTKAGIRNPSDLLQFPWDKNISVLSDEDADDLLNLMADFNKKSGGKS